MTHVTGEGRLQEQLLQITSTRHCGKGRRKEYIHGSQRTSYCKLSQSSCDCFYSFLVTQVLALRFTEVTRAATKGYFAKQVSVLDALQTAGDSVRV